MKKILTILALTILPLCCWAGEQGYAVYDEATATLTFKYGEKPSGDNVYDTDDTSWDGPDWDCSLLKTVVFDPSYAKARPESTSHWFNQAQSLENIIGIEYLNTSEVGTMSNMFDGCKSLVNLDVSHFNTSNVTQMYSMFAGCSSLTSLDVSNFDTSKVMNMFLMFSGCTNLTSLDLSHFDTHQVYNMFQMFSWCPNLTSLDISHFDTSQVTDMSQMFMGCESLTSLDLSHFNTSKTTDLNRMFTSCHNLQSIDLSSFDTGNVTDMCMMFFECNNLQGLDLSGFDTSHVTDMSYMFNGCSNLQSLNLSSFNTSNVTNMEWMFSGIEIVGNIDISHFDKRKLKDPWEMYYGCDFGGYAILDETGETLTFKFGFRPEGENVFDTDDTRFNYWPEKSWDCYKITKVVFDSSFADARPSSTARWFSCADQDYDGMTNRGYDEIPLKEIVGIEYLNTSNVTDMACMFRGCSSLTTIDLSHFDTGNVTDMYGMFCGCSGLTSIDLSTFDTSNVESMHSMFEGCSSLNSLDLSGLKTTNVTHMSCMFYGCSSLSSIDLRISDSKNLYAIYQMFYGCSSLTTLDLSHFDTKNVEHFWGMFQGCTSLENLNISNLDVSNANDIHRMFSGCKSLKQINLSSFDTKNLSSMDYLFEDCSSLTSLDLSHFDTSNLRFKNAMFKGCSSLTSVDLSSFNVEIDGASMFEGCSSLKTLNLCGFKATENFDRVLRNLGRMFYGCENLETIYASRDWDLTDMLIIYPEFIEEIFTGCNKLVGGAGSRYDDNGDSFFFACIDGGPDNPGYLTAAFQEEGVTYSSKDDGVSVVHASVEESFVDIPSNVNDGNENLVVNTIGEGAFENKTDLKLVSFPETISEIGENAFAGCSSLSAIYCFAVEPIVLGDANAHVRTRADGEEKSASTVFTAVDKESCVLYVPKNCRDKYRNAEGWAEFQNIEEMESDILGDANNDGEVDNKDLNAIANYILTEQAKNFIFMNADMNKDKTLNAVDIVHLVDKIKATQ